MHIRSFLKVLASAIALATVDINYALKRVISYVYLVDGVVELLLIAGWLVVLLV